MATNKPTNIPDSTEPTVQDVPTASNASKYTAKELIAANRTFNASREIVATALRIKGVTEATEAEARKIIEDFKKQEVK